MADDPLGNVLGHIRRAALALKDGPPDGVLLERFVKFRDESAFEALVRRHGGMVLGVCRRVLGNVHDAGDAFQATFLVLARKADSIRRPELLGNYLYGVAHRIARQVKRASARRRVREAQAAKPEGVEPISHEWREILDQELQQLPTIYRSALVLCDLEGLSRREAARQLSWPEGTLSGRLTRARRMLARRLTRHGYVFPATLLASLLASGASAVPSEALISSTLHAAIQAAGQVATAGLVSVGSAALMERLMQTMLTIRVKVVTVVVVLVGLVLVGGVFFFRSEAVSQAQAEMAQAGMAAKPMGSPMMRGERRAAFPSAFGGGSGGPTTPEEMLREVLPMRAALPPLQVVNKREVKIDFEVARTGSSGLGALDVYVTTDDGTTWEKSAGQHSWASAEAKPPGPAFGTVTLPLAKEGVIYGFRLVVKNRTGLGKPGPQPGDPPQVRIERDTTPPDAQLFAPQPAKAQGNRLNLLWKASDRNLAVNPVSLAWSAEADGPWTSIGAEKLPNTGKYSWAVPETVPAKVYLKLTVRDTAGNVAVVKTEKPVLIDLFVPGDVTIRGVR